MTAAKTLDPNPVGMTLEQEFLALLCADEEWVQAQFDALVRQFERRRTTVSTAGVGGSDSPLAAPGLSRTEPRKAVSDTVRVWPRQRAPPTI